jgi:hypothetical protein
MDFGLQHNFSKNFFFQHSYAYLNQKPHLDVFVKSHEWNFSYGIEMIQSTNIQYMTMYFIKCCNYLNHLKNIFALCSILVQVLIFHKCTI